MKKGNIKRCIQCNYNCLVKLIETDRKYKDMWVCKVLSNIKEYACLCTEDELEPVKDATLDELLLI